MPIWLMITIGVSIAIVFTFVGIVLGASWDMRNPSQQDMEEAEYLEDWRKKAPKIVYMSPDIEDSIVTPNIPDWKKASN